MQKEELLKKIKDDNFNFENEKEIIKYCDDREFMKEAVSNHGEILKIASDRLKNDREIALSAIKSDYRAYEYVGEELLKTDTFKIENLIIFNPNIIIYAPKNDDKINDLIKLAVQKNGLTLQFAPDKLKNNKNVVMMAVKENGHALQYASEELKNDKEVVLEAIKNTGFTYRDSYKEWHMFFIQFGPLIKFPSAMQYASQELKNNKEFVLEAIKYDYDAYKYISEELKKDLYFSIDTLIDINPCIIKYSSENDRNNKQLALKVVEKDGLALKFVSKELRDDKDVVLKAVKQNGQAIMYASEKLCNDKEIVKISVNSFGLNIEFASDKLKDDKEIVLDAVKDVGWAILYASERLKNDKDVILETVNHAEENIFKFIPKKMLYDKDIVVKGLIADDAYIADLPKELLNNKEFLLDVFKRINKISGVQSKGFIISSLSNELANDYDVVLEIVKCSGVELESASDKLRDNENIVMEAINDYPPAYECASKRIRESKEFLISLLKRKDKKYPAREILEYAPKKFVNDEDILKLITKVE